MMTSLCPTLFRAGLVAVVATLAFGFPASASEWQTLPGAKGGSCATGGVAGWSRYTCCWGKQRMIRDGQPRRDTYSFRMTLVGNALGDKHLDKLWVEPRPRTSSPAQHWRGTDPFKPDQTITEQLNCVTRATSVGGGQVPFTYTTSQQSCRHESFGPKLYKEPGHHAGIWTTDERCSMRPTEVRKVYVTMTVWVAAGRVPLWDSARRGAKVFRCFP